MLKNLPERNAMTITQANSDFDQIDHKTSRQICDAVGERLQQNMRAEASLSPRLQQLVDEMRRREQDRR
ncbi:hypothetical protein UP09_02415 [Bradyrhizobium sp. LTSP885]|nr:hypothetical protein UP09_02415 [Bradyrhizobium sp. LTSP885]